MSGVALIVLAKEPRPGRSKTRLCPPCTDAEAAQLAEAALADTLATAGSIEARDHVLVLDGRPGPWLGSGWRLLPQAGGGLGARIAHAFDAVGGPALLLGMDTPQVSAAMVAEGIERLDTGDVDAVLGPADDGGYWAIGLRRPRGRVFLGVPMSSDRTAEVQRRRLRELGLSCAELPQLRDVDTIADAHAVAAQAPTSRFAAALRACLAADSRASDFTGEDLRSDRPGSA